MGFLLLYLGAGSGWLGLVTGTCAQNSADDLFFGVYALVFYAAGMLRLIRRPRMRAAYLVLIPLAIPVWREAKFAVRLAYGYVANGTSACMQLKGGPYGLDGREPFFIAVWLGVVALLGLGLPFAIRRAGR